MSQFYKKLLDLLTFNGVSVPSESKRLLERYFELSKRWSEKINITSNLGIDNYLLENVMDPIMALQGAKRSLGDIMPRVITDYGCGGGYVGLTWALVDSQLRVHVVDADRKKINFCKQVIREVGLSARATATQWRVEELRDQEGLICSRATWGVDEFFAQLDSTARPGCVGAYLGGLDEAKVDSSIVEVIPYQIQPMIKRRAVFIRRESHSNRIT